MAGLRYVEFYDPDRLVIKTAMIVTPFGKNKPGRPMKCNTHAR
jgi:hypothetical protein